MYKLGVLVVAMILLAAPVAISQETSGASEQATTESRTITDQADQLVADATSTVSQAATKAKEKAKNTVQDNLNLIIAIAVAVVVALVVKTRLAAKFLPVAIGIAIVATPLVVKHTSVTGSQLLGYVNSVPAYVGAGVLIVPFRALYRAIRGKRKEKKSGK